MRLSIRYKFIIGLLIIFCSAFNLMTIFMDKIVMANNKKVISGELLNSQRDLSLYFKQLITINKIEPNEKGFQKYAGIVANSLSSKLNSRIILYKKDGSLLLDTDFNNGELYSVSGQVLKDNFSDLRLAVKGKSAYKIMKLDKDYRVIFSQPLYNDKNIIGIIRYYEEYTQLFDSSNNLLSEIKIFLFVLFTVIFVFITILSTRITIPIIRLTKAAREISKGNFEVNLDIRSKDELGELGENFNIMRRKIKTQIETIEKDRDDLLKLEKHRKVFFDNVTHEMKTPLTIIEGYSQMILDEGTSDAKLLEKAASKIKKESKKLHEMIVDILNLSKLESKVEVGIIEELNLADILNNICDDMSVRCRKYEIYIYKDFEDDTYIFANKEDICRMFINIIDNSIKYGDTKSTINIRLSKEDAYSVITVKDKGKGIKQDDLNKVFEPFYRGNKANLEKGKGSGLGLSIVKSIVDKYKGTINIESKIDEGTTVCIKIPLFLQLDNKLLV